MASPYIQYHTSLASAQAGSHQIPEVLYISDGTDSKLLFSNGNDEHDLRDYEDGTEIYVYGDEIYESYFDIYHCLAAGTKITMSDGTVKNIENIVVNDSVKAFNHETGQFESSKICIVDKGETQKAPLILHFTNNKSISIIGQHSLLEQESMKYVRISETTVDSFLGKKFYNAADNRWETLASFEMGTEPVEYYTIYSMLINCIANDFLTSPDDEDWELNVYELDENLKADAQQLADDIAQYGLLNVQEKCPEHPELWPVLMAMAKYMYIAEAKGYITRERARQLYKYWN